MTFWHDFCPDALFNSSQTWNTTNPELSRCMMDTVMTAVPCAFLWTATPIWIKCGSAGAIQSTFSSSSRRTRLFWLKLVLAILLMANEVGVFAEALVTRNFAYVFPSEWFRFILSTSTLMMAMCLMVWESNSWQLQHNSPCLFLYWLLMTILSVPLFKMQVEEISQEVTTWRLIQITTMFPTMVLLLIAACFSDASPSIDCPEGSASFFSVLWFSWMDPLIWRGLRSTITLDQVPKSLPFIRVHYAASKFIGNWQGKISRLGISFQRQKQQQQLQATVRKPISVMPVLLKSFGARMMFAFLIGTLQYTLLFINPQLVRLLIQHVQNETEEKWKGYLYAVVTLLISVTTSLLSHQALIQLVMSPLNMRAAMVSMVYRKTLRLSNAARRKYTTGEIINYMSTDAQKFLECWWDFSNIWFAPFRISVSVFFLFQELGYVAFAGVGLMSVLIPLNVWSTKTRGRKQVELMAEKDCRMKLISEMLSGIKVIKLHAWEVPFLDRVKSIRSKEIRLYQVIAKLWVLINTTLSSSTFFITLIVFGLYTVVNPSETLTADKIFVSITLLNLLKGPLVTLPFGIVASIDLFTALRRINVFLNAEELDCFAITDNISRPDENTIEIRNLTASWSEEAATLRNISIDIPTGSLTAVVGVVGSGKSSLLSAILGEMQIEEGTVAARGSIAYVPQQAWIQNMTLKNNILLQKKLQSDEYKRVLSACALAPDLEILAKGDETEIGENGITLSGGQKQRVSLARALYQNADIYLLDDPLASVDAHVGKHIFDHVISSDNGLIKDKTRVLVTNDVSNLKYMDQIIVLKNGAVADKGSFDELMSKGSDFSDLLSLQNAKISCMESERTERICNLQTDSLSKSLGSPEIKHMELYCGDFVEVNDADEDAAASADDSNVTQENRSLLSDTVLNSKNGRLIEDEAAQVGNVKWTVYKYYLKCMSYRICVLIFLLFLGVQGVQTVSSWWLSRWADANSVNATSQQTPFYLGTYAGLGAFQILLEVIQNLALFISAAKASQLIHDGLLQGIIKSPMSFFDTHPLGRVVNRFSSDMGKVDTVLPFQLGGFCSCLSRIVMTFVIICYTVPIVIPIVLPLFLIYLVIQKCYIKSSLPMRRLEGISKSPIYSHFGESIVGAVSIRAYRMEESFIHESEARLDQQTNCFYQSVSLNRWLAVRTELLASIVVFLSSLFAVVAKSSLTPGLVGLVITYAMDVSSALTMIIRMVSDLETDSVSLERILEYTKNPSEADWHREPDAGLERWPDRGKVTFESYQTRYREGLDLVLRDVNLCIQPMHKIGICGRTGAGKSSLTLALFRLIEPAAGRIVIDNIDISTIGLQRLRSNITIIPQDPMLFTGTIRFNLDPIATHDDIEVWTCLEHAGLKELVLSFPDGLEHEVCEKGENFSLGQRQLICLARALLRKTKVLILDEATAAVDLETDSFIQKAIRREFRNSTVITIAHRLNTILDCDSIAVFSEGKLEEFGEPEELLAIPGSKFSELARNAGLLQE